MATVYGSPARSVRITRLLTINPSEGGGQPARYDLLD